MHRSVSTDSPSRGNSATCSRRSSQKGSGIGTGERLALGRRRRVEGQGVEAEEGWTDNANRSYPYRRGVSRIALG